MFGTSQILIPGEHAYILAGEYSLFTASLIWFSAICSESPRRTKREYLHAFKNVKSSYASLLAARQISDLATAYVDELFEEISNEFQGKKVKDINLEKLKSLVEDFVAEVLTPLDRSFRHAFLKSAVSSHAKDFYSEELFKVVNNPLDNNDFDAAVLAAFKYLDGVLQRLTGVDSHQYYGEELINKAFSPRTGILQMNTHPTEQAGLRNWFSGANAVLRNPIAHRFVDIDEESALSAIAMVALMAKIATELSERENKNNDA